MAAGMVREGFGGPGGVAVALQRLGLYSVGMEWDAAACATRAAAGHLTIRCDIAQYPTDPFTGKVKGSHDSPPCQAWSRAGKGLGLVDQPLVHQAVHDLARGRDTRAELRAACADERSLLAAEPMRWHRAHRPEWITMEEVPDVLPLFQQYAEIFCVWGYSAWAGILNAADYGVPQTRRRAILIASRVRPVGPPPPTHTQHPGDGLFGDDLAPWVSMADALDLPAGLVVNTRGKRRTPGGNEFSADGPSQSLTGRARSWKLRSGQGWKLRSGQSIAGLGRYERAADRPAFTITSTANRCKWVGDGAEDRNLTLAEAAVLQAFPADYSFHGTRTKAFEQIGNAVPPLLAEHVIRAAAGIEQGARTVAAAA